MLVLHMRGPVLADRPSHSSPRSSCRKRSSSVNRANRTCRFGNGCRAFLVTVGAITSTLIVALSPAQFWVRATPGARAIPSSAENANLESRAPLHERTQPLAFFEVALVSARSGNGGSRRGGRAVSGENPVVAGCAAFAHTA